MSHYLEIETEINHQGALVRALGRMGFEGKIEVHDSAQNLYGYQGDVRNQKAHVIIRRKYVGNAANDIGFERLENGKYCVHISEFDQGKGFYSSAKEKYGDEWQKKLFTYYGVERAKIEFEKKKMKYTEEIDEQNRIRLRVRI